MDEERTPLLKDDEDIALAIMDRDERGLVALLETHGPKILGYLRKKYGHLLGEDEQNYLLYLAADTAWTKIDQFDDTKGDLGGWFFRIAQNHAIDYLRHRETQVTDTLGDRDLQTESWLDAHERGPQESSIPTKLERAVNDIINKELSPQQREVIWADMAAADQADNEYLATRLGTSVPAVHTARSKAHRKIRDSLRQRGFDIPEGDAS